MAANDFSVADLSRAMERATDDFKRTVGGLIEAAPHTLQGRLQSIYPQGPTGTLRRRITISSGQPRASSGTPVAVRKVRATAPHIHMWQEGTRDRFDSTRANASRGRMPAGGQVFERTAGQVRREMLNKAERELNRTHEI